MGKGRVRVKGGKGERWRRGQSGLSNPREVSHRQAARGKFGNHLSRGKASAPLTAEALATLDTPRSQLDRDGDVDLEMGSDGGGSTSVASSSALTLIQTSHPVFGAVRKLWNSPTESHRVICAVLAAVSDVVRSQEGNNSGTEYYGALMSVLELCDDEKSVAAICYLLCLLMPSLPGEVLQVKYNTSVRILTDQLARHEASSSTALLKSLVKALSLLLEAQPAAVWSHSHSQKVFQNILNFTVHPKPKLRKAAQSAVVSMLREGSSSGEPHSAAPATARHCSHVIERGGETATLHVLGLLRECLANLPTQHVKTLCEAILKTMTLGNTMVRTTCLRTLYGGMVSLAGPQGLTPSLTARIISALYDHQPGLGDGQLLQAWLTVMETAHIRLARLDGELCVAHLVRLFSVAVSCLASHNTTVTHTSSTTIQNILTTVVGPRVASLQDTSQSQLLQQIGDMYNAVVKGLDFKNRSSWNHILKALAVFHRIAGDKCHSVMAQHLPTIVSLRSLPDFTLSSALDEAVGTAISTMGPQVVLTYVPLKLDTSGDKYPPNLETSWLLPVLRDNISSTQLAFFRDHLLPLATSLKITGERYQREGKKMAAKIYSILYHQVWSLLPGFCRAPLDVRQSFPSLARILGTALSVQPLLRVTIATALRQLVESCRGKEEEEAVVARFSKNYLPILFNLYTGDGGEEEEEGVRQAVLQCAEGYITITESSLVTTLTSSALTNLSLPTLSPGKKYRLLDLVAVMASYLPLPPLRELLDTVSPLLDNVDPRLQKKGYKVLERVLTSQCQSQKAFVQQNLSQLLSLLSGSLSTSSTASKKPRLRCLLSLLDHIGLSSHTFLKTLTPEVILCTKETNEKCRVMAFQLLVRMGHIAQYCYDLNPADSLTKYVGVVLEGVATGSPHLVSASIISLSRLLFEFKDVVSTNLVSQLLASTLSLLSSHSREVVKAAFGFIKITIKVLPAADLSPHLEDLIRGILRWSSDPKSHFRLKARVILERLCRKFGFETVSGVTPAKGQRLLAHIRKTNERLKKKKRTTLNEDSEEEEEEEEEEGRGGRGSWIRESLSGGDPVDFLDKSLASRISSTHPKQMQSGSEGGTFPTSVHGKLLISDQPATPAEQSDEKIELEVDTEREMRRRKRKREEGAMGEEGVGGGGRGIHRKLPGKMDFNYGSEYRAKKARGDVKVKGRPDPYAYVPLLGQKLNRRKRAKLSGQFQGLMRKARTGAAAGARQKGRSRK